MITEVPKFEKNYNSKIDYRFIAFSNMGKDTYECNIDDLMVYLGKKTPENPMQWDILRTKHMFELLKTKGICVETIEECINYFHLCFDSDKKSRLNRFLSQLAFADPFDDACKLFMFVIKKKIFNELSQKFAIVLLNGILVQHHILPIIFYLYFTLHLCELIESGLTLDSFKDILMQKFENSIAYNTPHELINDVEITNKVKEIRAALKTKFGVIHATITGSFAKKLYTEFSDLDIIIEMEDYARIHEVKSFIQEKVKIPVDVIRADDSFLRFKDLQTYRIEVF